MIFIKKPIYQKKIEEFIRSFGNIDYSLALTILCSNSINLMDEVISIISILEAVNYNIENLYNLDGMKYSETKKFLITLGQIHIKIIKVI